MTLAILYNLRQVFSNVPKNFGAFLDLRKGMASSSSFRDTELQRALKEQTFGIKKFTISSSSEQPTAATIVLLEGTTISVQMTTQGYSIVSTATTTVYETLEDLLQAASPMYTKKRQEILFAKLSKLSR